MTSLISLKHIQVIGLSIGPGYLISGSGNKANQTHLTTESGREAPPSKHWLFLLTEVTRAGKGCRADCPDIKDSLNLGAAFLGSLLIAQLDYTLHCEQKAEVNYDGFCYY